MHLPTTYKETHVWGIIAILIFVLFASLGSAPIYILDEAKNAQCAREMFERNDWVVPTFNGELRTDKPVLHYYFMMVAYKVFGVSEFSARFFSALLGVLTVLLTYFSTKKYLDARTGFCACLVLVASTQFLFEFRLSVPDPYLIFFIAAGLFCGFTYVQTKSLSSIMLTSVAFGLAILAKGPVALALPGLCLLIWIIYKKYWSAIFSWKLVLAIIIVAVITLPWYLAVHKATSGAWTRGFFIDHNINRFSDPQEGHGGFFLITPLFVLIGLLPFTAFSVSMYKQRELLFTKDLTRFSGIVVLAFVIFFSIASTRLPNYPMPCYPFAAIIIGSYLSQTLTGVYALKKIPVVFLTILLFLIPVAGCIAIYNEVETIDVSWIALLLLAAPLFICYFLFKWKLLTAYQRILRLLAVYTLFNLLALHIVYPIIYRQNPVSKTISRVKTFKNVFAFEIYNPGYNFYLNQPIKRFTSVDSLQASLIRYPDALVISRAVYADTLKRLALRQLASHHDLFELPTTVLYVKSNKP